jgi:hypothetical protein
MAGQSPSRWTGGCLVDRFWTSPLIWLWQFPHDARTSGLLPLPCRMMHGLGISSVPFLSQCSFNFFRSSRSWQGLVLTPSSKTSLFCDGALQSTTFGSRELWSTRAPNKCMFYNWTVLHDQCWTLDRLHRHSLPNNGPCAFCDQEDEMIDHLIDGCAFSRET